MSVFYLLADLPVLVAAFTGVFFAPGIVPVGHRPLSFPFVSPLFRVPLPWLPPPQGGFIAVYMLHVHEYNIITCYMCQAVFCCLLPSLFLWYDFCMSTYKGFTPSRQKANDKYLSEKVDSIMVRVPKGKKAELQDAAAAAGLSLNQFCVSALLEKLPDNSKPDNMPDT